MTDVLYRPEPVLAWWASTVSAALAARGLTVRAAGAASTNPEHVTIGTALTDTPPRTVNFWPSSPELEALALAGGLRATLSGQVTVVGLDVNDARLLGGLVRSAFRLGPRGAMVAPRTFAGGRVDTVTMTNGRADDSGGVATWTELYAIQYQASGA